MVRARSATPFVLAAVASAAAATVGATAPPVGPLPAGPTTTVATQAGELVAVALPSRSRGRVWRIARAFDSTVLHEVSEADVGSNVVLVFKTARAGSVTVRFALTRGETSKALETRTYRLHVR
jgi:hypothetical protein